MSLINCKNNRYTCGTPYPSTCVGYQGEFNGVLVENDFQCNVNLDDIINKLSVLLKTAQIDIVNLKSQIVTINTALAAL